MKNGRNYHFMTAEKSITREKKTTKIFMRGRDIYIKIKDRMPALIHQRQPTELNSNDEEKNRINSIF